jgi:dihydroorotase-like cyclic amidohydrolase
MSTKPERDLVWEAKTRGQLVTAEVCPHHLLFNKKMYNTPEARYYVMNPALKTADDQEALWEGLVNGAVDMVVTDHAAYTRKEKDLGKENVLKSWAGVAGLEFSYRLLITYGVTKNRFSWQRLAQIMAENPARLFGLYPQKGALRVGSDADIVIYNPKGSRQLSDKDLRCVADYTIYDGIRIKGDIEEVLVRGKTVTKNLEVKANPGFGEFVAGHPNPNPHIKL